MNKWPRCKDCVRDNYLRAPVCQTCVAGSNFLPRGRSKIYYEPATIVFWADGTKTVVKAVYDEFDPEKGLAMAIAKKALGNKGNYYNVIAKWTDEYLEKEDK